jgi:hypothetical protein
MADHGGAHRLKRLAGRMPWDKHIFAHAEGCVGINTSSLSFEGCVGIKMSSLIFEGWVGIKISFLGFPQPDNSCPSVFGRFETLRATVGRTIAKDNVATTMANVVSDFFFISI